MEKAGLYFHIPFCKSKCPYCDFYSVKYEPSAAKAYSDRLCREMNRYSGEFDTVYFGGGTPSILDSELIEQILSHAREVFDIDKNAEITIECNPSKNLERDFEKYASIGINRVSIGMQSARNEERFALGRSAGQEQVAKAVSDANRAGINNISLDVMLATPKQTLSSLDYTFDFISSTDVTHISAYLLKIENGTKFFEIKNKLALVDEDEASEMYLKTISSLKALGFKQYEISSFAKSGYKSRHNLKYWRLVPYLGLGKSAHSFYGGRRFFYDNDFNKIDDGVGGTRDERLMLSLRLCEGADKSLLNDDGYKKFIQSGFLGENDGKIFLTEKGMLVSNFIISELL